MIEISQLAKKFTIENPKKLSEQEKKDPRLKGKFFHSVQDVSLNCAPVKYSGYSGLTVPAKPPHYVCYQQR